MSGRDPSEVLAKAASKGGRKSAKQTRHMKHATVLADLFGKLSVQLAAGDVDAARRGSHRAHALLEVLAAMDAQDQYLELQSAKCEERRQAASAWSRLMRPSVDTTKELRNHFETRTFSFVRTAPLPRLPEPEPKKSYKGGIYTTFFLPDDAKLAKELGLPESYSFRHGVTNAGFKHSLHWAIGRKVPALERASNIRVLPSLQGLYRDINAFNTLNVTNFGRSWRESPREVRYSIHSTTHAETAAELAVWRKGAKATRSVGRLK